MINPAGIKFGSVLDKPGPLGNGFMTQTAKQTGFTLTFPRALMIAMLVAALDQCSKRYVLEAVGAGLIPLRVLACFNLTLVWNKGVSFGLFAQMPAVMALLVWMRRATHSLTRLALGCIVGGATGNIIDRIRYGAVTDFLDFHWRHWHWPAFNLADSAIFIGVVLLIGLSIMQDRRNHERGNQKADSL
jgi:signal peptidase II